LSDRHVCACSGSEKSFSGVCTLPVFPEHEASGHILGSQASTRILMLYSNTQDMIFGNCYPFVQIATYTLSLIRMIRKIPLWYIACCIPEISFPVWHRCRSVVFRVFWDIRLRTGIRQVPVPDWPGLKTVWRIVVPIKIDK